MSSQAGIPGPPSSQVEGLVSENSGSLFLITAVMWIIEGALTVQFGNYASRSKDEPWYQKIWISLLFGVNVLLAGAVSFRAFSLLIHDFGDADAVENNGQATVFISALAIIPGFLAQIWFGRRLYLVNQKHWVFPLIACLVSVATFGLGVSFVITLNHLGPHSPVVAARTLPAWLIGNAVSDFMVSIPLAWELHHLRTGFRTTDRLLNKIIWVVVGTSSLTTFAALLSVSLYFLPNLDMQFNVGNLSSVQAIQGPLYGNAVLIFLNRRGRGQGSTHEISSDTLQKKSAALSISVPRKPPQTSISLASATREDDESIPMGFIQHQDPTISATRARRFRRSQENNDFDGPTENSSRSPPGFPVPVHDSIPSFPPDSPAVDISHDATEDVMTPPSTRQRRFRPESRNLTTTHTEEPVENPKTR